MPISCGIARPQTAAAAASVRVEHGRFMVCATSFVVPQGIKPMGFRIPALSIPEIISYRVPSPPQQTTTSYPSAYFQAKFAASPGPAVVSTVVRYPFSVKTDRIGSRASLALVMPEAGLTIRRIRFGESVKKIISFPLRESNGSLHENDRQFCWIKRLRLSDGIDLPRTHDIIFLNSYERKIGFEFAALITAYVSDRLSVETYA